MRIVNQSVLKFMIVIALLVVLGSTIQRLQAQKGESPLIFWTPKVRLNDYYAVGDLWTFDTSNNELNKLATWVAQGTEKLSPDGKQIALTVYDQLAVDQITQEQPQNYDWPVV